MIRCGFLGADLLAFSLVCQVKGDTMILWMHVVMVKMECSGRKEADIDKAARGLYSPKRENLRNFG